MFPSASGGSIASDVGVRHAPDPNPASRTALGIATLAVAGPAAAQSIENRVTHPIDEPAAPAAPAAKLPPGLPGAQSQGEAAPINRIPTDMPPDQALFDAINRGDIASARDALSRGASPNSRNVLGMTALNSAIDQGRNDIAFLLLSMRGTGASGPSSGAQVAGPPPKPEKPVRAASGPRARPAVEQVASNPTAPPAARAPRLFADDGGTPAPQVGFLGFGPSHCAG